MGAIILLGTGLGTAFQMWLAHRTGSAPVIAVVARHVVLADWLFTLPFMILQPATGLWLAWRLDWALDTGWLLLALHLYGVAAACWLVVVVLQRRISALARQAAAAGIVLPAAYDRQVRLWFLLGWPALLTMMAILVLMVFKPEI